MPASRQQQRLLGGASLFARHQALRPAAYWPQGEASGTAARDASGNGRNGVYTAVTLAQTGVGDGRSAASYDGSTSFLDIYAAFAQTVFNGQLGTFSIWLKVASAGVWTDATLRRFLVLQADGSNRILLQKASSNNLLQLQYIAGGTTSIVSPALSTTAWFHLAVTWNKAADQYLVFVNGVQSGATQTGLGTFAGAVASNLATVGAGSTGATAVWSGLIQHAAVWTTALSAPQIASIARL